MNANWLELENMINEETDLVSIVKGNEVKLYTPNKRLAKLTSATLIGSLQELELTDTNWQLVDSLDLLC